MDADFSNKSNGRAKGGHGTIHSINKHRKLAGIPRAGGDPPAKAIKSHAYQASTPLHQGLDQLHEPCAEVQHKPT
jgi:hypothetical protein